MIIKSPLVVGYKGEIGSFILNGLLKEMPKASDIWCVDVNDDEEEVLSRIEKADYIFLCVPIEKTIAWLEEWETHLTDKFVIEQCSLKRTLFEQRIVKNRRINFISMHLLFKPSGTPNASDRICLLWKDNRFCNVGDNLIANLGSNISNMLNTIMVYDCKSFEEHDKVMALQQSLVHRIILALDKMTSKDKHAQTFVGKRVKELANRIKLGNPLLYGIIQANPHLEEVMKEFETELKNFNINNYMK